jgi:formate hydrogenlyase subunit 4
MGLSSDGELASVILAIVLLFLKMLIVAAVVVTIEVTYAKLRLYKITEFIATGLLVAILATFVYVIGV